MKASDISQRLMAMKRPAVALKSATKSTRGFSRLGGLPNLPEGTVWPEWNGAPLAFLAQIDLAELPSPLPLEHLPATGRLYFFFDQEQSVWGIDPKDRGGWQVLYSQDAPSAAPNPAPAGLEDVFDEKYLSAHAIDSIPSPDRLNLDLSDSDNDDAFDEASDAIDALRDDPFEDFVYHQMGGYPNAIQSDDMELDCQMTAHGLSCGTPEDYQDPRIADLEKTKDDWQLLLQIDSDDDTAMMWGDSGTLYFWIRSQDLAKRDFSKVWMILQCC